MLVRYLVCIMLIVNVSVSCLIHAQTHEPKTLIVSVNSPGSYPYLYFDSTTQQYMGLVVDFFHDLHQQGLFNTQYIDSNQMRSEQFLLTGKADIYLANPVWLSQPSKFISSIPIVQHATYLYSLRPFEPSFSIDKLHNKRICTHQDFTYTGLENYFVEHAIKRVDASSQYAMANMLKKQRCDYLAMNDYNATAIFSASDYCNLTIYQSPQPTSVIDLHYVMRPKLSETKRIIDQQLSLYNASGKTKAAMNKHSKPPYFPMQQTCSSL